MKVVEHFILILNKKEKVLNKEDNHCWVARHYECRMSRHSAVWLVTLTRAPLRQRAQAALRSARTCSSWHHRAPAVSAANAWPLQFIWATLQPCLQQPPGHYSSSGRPCSCVCSNCLATTAHLGDPAAVPAHCLATAHLLPATTTKHKISVQFICG